MKNIKFYKSEIVLIILAIIMIIVGIIPKKSTFSEEGLTTEKKPTQLLRQDQESVRVGVDVYDNPLNPFYESKAETSLLSKLINRSLFKEDENGIYQPDLASHYWIEEGGRKIHIILKQGIEFSDGTELDSKLVADNLKVLADPTYDGQKSFNVDNIKGYYQFKRGLDPNALAIDLKEKYYFTIELAVASKDTFSLFDFPIVNLNQVPYDYGDTSDVKDFMFFDGLGNYRVEKYIEGSQYSLIRDTEDESIPEKLKVYLSPFFMAQDMYRSGTLDILYKYEEENYDALFADQGEFLNSYIITNQSSSSLTLGFNIQEGFFKESLQRKVVRENIDFASIFFLNKERGTQIPIYQHSMFYETFDRERYGPVQEPDLNLYFSGVNPVTMAVDDSFEFVRSNEQILKDEFAKIGLILEVVYVSPGEMYNIINGNHPYDMYISDGSMIKIPTLANQHVYNFDRQVNINSIDDPEMVEYLEKISRSNGDENFAYLVHSWMDWFLDEQPYIIITTKNQNTVISDRIKGISINEFQGLDNLGNLQKLKIY